MTKLYGAITNNVRYVQNGAGGPIQVWEVEGVYKIYSDNGPMAKLRPYGKWRISIVLNVLHQKLPFSGDSDILKCNLVRFRTDIDGNPIGAPDLIQKNGNQGVILEGIPEGAQPTWTWDLTSGPFVFTDFLEIPEQDAYCFMAFDAIFTTREVRSYVSGTISGVNPYNTVVGGNSNSDPLALFNNTGNIFQGPPPTTLPGDWVLPLEPMFVNGAVNGVNPGFGGGTGQVIFGLDQLLGVGAWGSPRPTWTADFTAQRLVLIALFVWKVSTGRNISFTSVSLSETAAVTYLWDFGDGATDTSQNPTHTFPSSGTYRVTLSLADNLGETSKFDQVVILPLKANFTVLVNGSISAFVSITLTNLSLGAVTFDWDWGDGTPHGTTEAPSHIYAKGHLYVIALTVGDGTGKTDSFSRTINP